MAIAFVNSAVGDAGAVASSTIASAAFSVTTGNTIIVGVSSYNAGAFRTVTGIADTAGNTYTKCGAGYNADAGSDIEIWVATNITGNASNIVTATFSNTTAYRHIAACQYSGLATSSVYDAGSTGKLDASDTTSHSSNTAVTSVADEVIVCWFVTWNTLQTYSASSPYTIRANGTGGNLVCMVDQIVSSTGTYGVTVGTSSANQQVSIARTFKMQQASPATTYASSLRVVWIN